ncbi:MAG: phosphoribosylformylglycinamidine synthase subunit PurQ [Candidatus Omnitrophica bacterium]|nr:phosphoribosylformylglycinamidine synthase subunit PurQ [Candidatus Omnitrophota bacterium]
MKFGIVVFPGSNCDQDCYYVINDIFKQPVKYIWHEDTALDGFDCIILPGGFSYGDYLRTGSIARFSPVMKSVAEFAGNGGSVIGICNGFQILLEAGLLPGVMLRNNGLHFICKYVYIKAENNSTRFTGLYKAGQVLRIPIAHNEGNYYIDAPGLAKLKENNQIVFRYCSESGETDDRFNPNGALDNVSGIINKEGNILGMMPHPERSSELELGSRDGYHIFDSVIKWLKTRGR